MPKVKLTKRVVNAAHPDTKDVLYWDTEVTGFFLKITPKGKKSYYAYYRTKAGQQRKPLIGPHGEWTCENARNAARKILQDAREGGDFSKERKDRRKAETVEQLTARYLDEYAESNKKASSIKQDRRMIKKKIVPAIGSFKVVEVTRSDIHKLHQSMRETPYEANRVLSLANKMFNLAEKWELRPDVSNPCLHIDSFPEYPRERFLSDAELKYVAKSFARSEKYRLESDQAIAALRLIMLTGARHDEVRTLRWEWINLDRQSIDLPDSKSGKKSIPLSEPVMDFLLGLERKENNPFCFSIRNNKPIGTLQKSWKRIRDRATVLQLFDDDNWYEFVDDARGERNEVPAIMNVEKEAQKVGKTLPIGLRDVRIHDLRHTFASQGIELGLSLPMIGKLLGHTTPAATARYSHLADDPQRKATSEISKKLSKILKR